MKIILKKYALLIILELTDSKIKIFCFEKLFLDAPRDANNNVETIYLSVISFIMNRVFANNSLSAIYYLFTLVRNDPLWD
jgi:hypothetical protein